MLEGAVVISMLVIALILFIFAGLLISAETSIGRISRSRVEETCQGVRADKLLVILGDRARYVNVLLFVSTVASVSAFALVSFELIGYLDAELGWSFIAAFAACADDIEVCSKFS